MDDATPAWTPAPPFPPEGVEDALHAIVRDLQVTPRRYRWFGVWWWPVKAMLRRAGMAPLIGPELGTYMDAEAVAALPRALLTPGHVLAEAAREYQFAARLDPGREWADTPAGDRVRIHDPDMEG